MLNNIRLLLLALWLGAAIFFSAVVAPSAFRVLRPLNLPNGNEIAGAIVSRTITAVNISGFIISLLLIVTAFALKNRLGQGLFLFQVVLLIIVAVTTGLGEWVIAARMRVLRAAFSAPIDQIPAGDAGRMAFDVLHGYSVAALSVAMIAALIALFVISKRIRMERE
jgi:uncharacterized protein DUF4149